VLPVGQVGDLLLVAFANPFEVTLPAKIQEMTGKRVVRLLAREKDIKDKFNKGNDVSSGFDDVVQKIGVEYGSITDRDDLKDTDVNEESGPIIQLANRIIEDAYISRGERHPHRAHGEGRPRPVPDRRPVPGEAQASAQAGRPWSHGLKIMCNLDISGAQAPAGRPHRLQAVHEEEPRHRPARRDRPMNYGEKVVMRILDKQKSTLPLTALGFSEENLERYRECIRQPYGMILHCGPTGSGKSMTLYSALNEINTPDIVIRTAEDPIEYTLPGINQMQMHRQIGLTFATALAASCAWTPTSSWWARSATRRPRRSPRGGAHRAPPRLDPPHERRALHHRAPDGHGDRAVHDLGVAPLRVRPAPDAPRLQALQGPVRAQGPREGDPREGDRLERPDLQAQPPGLPGLQRQGYKGRVGIHELMVNCEELIEGINKKMETAELKKIAVRQGMKTLHQDSLTKVKEGISTLEEAIATVPPDL
jgi:type IV pilus assembly protein PilB